MNKYGYRYNISNPQIRRWYDAYKQANKIPCYVGLNHGQRLELEANFLDVLWSMGKLEGDVFIGNAPKPAASRAKRY